MTEQLKRGDQVRLLSLPTGYTSCELPLTVGNIYVLHYLDGNNVCTSTDAENLNGHYHRDRVEKVSGKYA